MHNGTNEPDSSFSCRHQSPNPAHQNLAANSLLTSGTANICSEGGPGEKQTDPCSGLQHNDPRAYYIRHRNLTMGNAVEKPTVKITRILTSRLPLETIPEDSDLHIFTVTWPGGLDTLASATQKISELDTYIRRGVVFDGLTGEHSKETVRSWTFRLITLMREKCQPKIVDFETILRLDLETVLKKHMTMANLIDV
jgi:hypothetical protein